MNVESRQGRVQLRPARDRLPLRRRAGHRGQPRGLQDGGQGDRGPARQVADVHGEVRRARGQLVPHPPVAARRPTASIVFWDDAAGIDDAALRAVRRRRARHDAASCTLLYAPNINSYKRFADGSFAPTTIAWGEDNRTCAVRAGRPRRRRPDGEPGARRRRQPVPGPGRHAGRWPARHRERA